MELSPNSQTVRWIVPPLDRLVMAVVAILLLVVFYVGLRDLVALWETQEEYSFGYMVPPVVLYLLWQRREQIATTRFEGSWSGPFLVALALALLLVGQVATLGTVVQYAFLLCLFGLVVAYTGWWGLKVVGMPLAILVFMVPLPNYFLRELSQALQLWSSQLGVLFIRAFGISVFLEGNVIDLGSLRLQVVEACSGLRYLLPLMTIGFIAAYMFQAAFWKRVVLFLSTIPVTLLMNSVRIGLIGILSEHFGKSMAEGFLHDFEGWAVFMVCTALLVVEMTLLARLGSGKRVSLSDVFHVPATVSESAHSRHVRPLPKPFLASGILIFIAALLSQTVALPSGKMPERLDFSEFPMDLQTWHGRSSAMDQNYLRMLKLDDYLLADYASAEVSRPVNFYVSYYSAQANGNSAHSPRACIPGDGWEISSFSQRRLSGIDVGGKPLTVNRVVIQRGDNKQLVYYWFQQQGKAITDEYMVKLQIFWDAITEHRSDGAMVRLVTRLVPGEPVDAGDATLERFAADAVPLLTRYVPD